MSYMKKSAIVFFIFILLQISLATPLFADRVIRVGIYQSRPMIFVDKNLKVNGFYADIIEYIAGMEGWRIKYVPGTWSQCLERLESGEIDIQTAIAYSEAREARFDFTSVPVYINWGQIYGRRGHDIHSFTDLEGRAVIGIKEDIYYDSLRDILKKFGIKCTFIQATNYAEVFEFLRQKRGDAGVVSRTFGGINSRVYGVDETAMIFAPVNLCFALTKGRHKDLIDAMDRHLTELKDDRKSVYYQSFNRWLGGGPGVRILFPLWLRWTLLITAGLLVLLSVFIVALKIQVRAKTKSLRESEEILKTILAVSPVGLCLMLQDRTIEWANKALHDMTGYEEGTRTGKNTSILYQDMPEYERAGGELYGGDGEEGAGYTDTRLVHRDGTTIDCYIQTRPMDLSDPSQRYIAVIMDITPLKQAEEKIKRSLREKEALLAEIHHRVKNNMQIISSMLSLQSKHIEDKKALATFQDSQGRIKSMALIHEKLYQASDLSSIDFGIYIRDLSENLFRLYGVTPGVIDLEIDAGDITFEIETSIPCGLIISELISNSLKYAFPDGRKGKISVTLRGNERDNGYVLTVSDDGIGIPEEMDTQNTDTLGMELVDILTQQLDGTIKIDRTNGTTFKITFEKRKYRKRI
ncbi:MAG: transporter substrate-binding domain-containing protein [Deltaproteobacteria bacterium]|nr:transporter substrate-binding domain-containing protein [Deltaproteobacteria bacterium]